MNATYKYKSVVIVKLLSSLQDKVKRGSRLINCQLSKTDFYYNYHTCSITKSHVISAFLRLHLIAQVKYTHTHTQSLYLHACVCQANASLGHHLICDKFVSKFSSCWLCEIHNNPSTFRSKERRDVYYSLYTLVKKYFKKKKECYNNQKLVLKLWGRLNLMKSFRTYKVIVM
ncbi:hypothetical protein ACB094_12G180000 [Castanea mollissima]